MQQHQSRPGLCWNAPCPSGSARDHSHACPGMVRRFHTAYPVPAAPGQLWLVFHPCAPWHRNPEVPVGAKPFSEPLGAPFPGSRCCLPQLRVRGGLGPSLVVVPSTSPPPQGWLARGTAAPCPCTRLWLGHTPRSVLGCTICLLTPGCVFGLLGG